MCRPRGATWLRHAVQRPMALPCGGRAAAGLQRDCCMYRRSRTPACRAPRAGQAPHELAMRQRAPQPPPPPQRAPQCVLGAPRQTSQSSKAWHVMVVRARTVQPSSSQHDAQHATTHAASCHVRGVHGSLITVCRLHSLQSRSGQCKQSAAISTICLVPALVTQRAPAPAPRQGAPRLLPRPQRAPRRVLGAPRHISSMSEAHHTVGHARLALPSLPQRAPGCKHACMHSTLTRCLSACNRPAKSGFGWQPQLPSGKGAAHLLSEVRPLVRQRRGKTRIRRAHAHAPQGRARVSFI